VREYIERWEADTRAGIVALVGGTALATLVNLALGAIFGPMPNPGVVYLPVIAMLGYHWDWRFGAAGAALQLLCVSLFFQPSPGALKLPTGAVTEQLLTLAAADAFILALVQLAHTRRTMAEREAGRFAALNSVGRALAGELDEARLLRLIAQTARDLTGAGFAAFTLRPLDPLGQPLVPSEGNLFHLAGVVGVSQREEELFRRMPLGGEGILAPIFRHGLPVRVDDALALRATTLAAAHAQADGAHATPVHPAHSPEASTSDGRGGRESPREAGRRTALDYAHGLLPAEGLRAVGVPHGHPIVRSFLGVPLSDREGLVRGGLLLGHAEPGRFTAEDEALILGLASQASVALENAWLFRSAQAQAQELDAIFENIADGVTLVNDQGQVLRENRAARRLREALEEGGAGEWTRALVREPAARAIGGEAAWSGPVHVPDGQEEPREYLVNASPLRLPDATVAEDGLDIRQENGAVRATGAVVAWHDVTEARRLLAERRARAEAEAGRALLRAVVNQLPSGVCLVRGQDARLVLANHAAAEVWGGPWMEDEPIVPFLQRIGTRVFRPDGQRLPDDELATLRALRTGAAVRHHQEIIRHADGTTLPILFNAVTLDPSIIQWSAPAADGTEDALEPLAVVVLQDVTALKDAERLKDEFIAIAAHELRNPMAALKGYADMLTRQGRRGVAPPLADWQGEAIEAIDQATTRLVELTDDLLDVTRLQAGRLDLQLVPADLVALARRVARRLQVTTERHQLDVDAREEFVVARMDVRRMEQVLGNLIGNAIKYSPAGGPVAIGIHEDCAMGVAELCVRDQGIGIPAEQQARIFGRFARADNAKALGITGTGLGLFLSHELVERQGGRIWFESAEGRGTTIMLTLPLAAEDDADGAGDDVLAGAAG
jgi:two-component system phosphate regulon sensor histidine kinase PhoR